MNVLLWTLHIMVCVILIAVVLLQRGKGADMGAALGGGSSNTVFGSRGAGNFLTKVTTASAIIFMGTSLTLFVVAKQDSAVFSGLGDEAPITTTTETDADASAAAEDESDGDSSLLQEIPSDGGSVLQEIPAKVPSPVEGAPDSGDSGAN